MKKKIISFLVVMFLIGTILPVTGTVDNKDQSEKKQNY